MSRELDAKVATRVMGLTVLDGEIIWTHARYEDQARNFELPYYTQDVRDDYEVLKRVREKWDSDNKTKFEDSLSEIWNACYDRNGRRGLPASSWNVSAMYEPGDYAKSALLALGEDIDALDRGSK